MWRTAEASILSPGDRTALPTPSQLERTALSLERKGNLRLLICVVEQWAEVGDPTPVARLAQIRAFLELCVMDRAWARLQPILEDHPSSEAYRLAGKVSLERGQIEQAQALLRIAVDTYPNEPALSELLSESDEPGTVVDFTDPVVDDADGQARLATRLLVEGAHLKARRILERVRKTHPDHTRTSDLLWALEGEFALRGVTLSDLARVHATPHALIDIADASEDHTESVSADVLRKALGDDIEAPGAFPSLFKNLADPGDGLLDDGPLENEVTLVSTADAAKAAVERDLTVEPAREDTQIMHVVRIARGEEPDATDTLVDAPYDLKVHDQVDGESEDENVIVRRRVDNPVPKTEVDTSRIQLDPARERVQSGANPTDEAAEFMRPRKKRPPPVVEELPKKPRLSAAPRGSKPRQASDAVTLERLPPAQRQKIDPKLASAPTEILELPAPTHEGQQSSSPLRRLAPWTGWLLVLVLLGLAMVSVGVLLIAAALTTS